MANVKPDLIGGRQNAVYLSATVLSRPFAVSSCSLSRPSACQRAKRRSHFAHSFSLSSYRCSQGREQARLLGVRLKEEALAITEVHASTAMRASQTAQIACKEAGFDPKRIVESDTIVEMSQGGWEQQERSKVYIPANLNPLRANPWEFRPPGVSPDGAHGESHRDIEGRLLDYLDTHVLPRGSWLPGEEPPVVLVFCHGLLIKAALRGVMGASPHFTHRLETTPR